MKIWMKRFAAAVGLAGASLASAAHASADSKMSAFIEEACKAYPVSQNKLNSNMATHLLVVYDMHKSGKMMDSHLEEIAGAPAAAYIKTLDLGPTSGAFAAFLNTKGYSQEDAVARQKESRASGRTPNDFGFENINCPLNQFDLPDNKAANEFKALVKEYQGQL